MIFRSSRISFDGCCAAWWSRTAKAWKAIVCATLSLSVAGCVVAHRSNFSFHEDQCRMFHGWCVVGLPGADLAIGAAADSQNTEETRISFRLAPRNGVAAAWSSAEITVIDLDTSKPLRLKVLDTHPVVGRSIDPHIKEEHWVLYGPYSASEFRLNPRIAKMELRFPPILVDGREVPVAPVRIDDGFRAPVLFIYHSH